ncbi:hypothetical protein EMCRGX_G017770 [Ephydatia muelleri]
MAMMMAVLDPVQHCLPPVQHRLRHVQHHLRHVQHHLCHVQHHLRHVQDEAEMADDEDEVEEDEEEEDEEEEDEEKEDEEEEDEEEKDEEEEDEEEEDEEEEDEEDEEEEDEEEEDEEEEDEEEEDEEEEDEEKEDEEIEDEMGEIEDEPISSSISRMCTCDDELACHLPLQGFLQQKSVFMNFSCTFRINALWTRTAYYIYSYAQPVYRTVTTYQCCPGFVGTPATSCLPFCSPTCVHGQCTDPNICTCTSGWTGESCGDDVDECLTNNGGCGHSCTNTLGSYTCSCNSGYSLAYDDHQCTDIDECKENLSGCNQNCTNTNGSFSCSCYSSGYVLVNGNTCTDLNECSVDNGGCDHQCSNTVGSYTCKCNRGYKLRDGKHTCESVQCSEIQEPEHGNMICDGNETGNSCVFTCQRGYNLIGSQIRHCLLTLQWSGSTTSCAMMNCTPVPHTANANLNLPCSGQYNTSCSIRCANGYTLVGSDIQHCTFDDNTRAVEWTSAPSSCNKGDPCASNPCMHNGTCTSTEDGLYVCNCTATTGYGGPLCNTGEIAVQVLQAIKVGSNASILLSTPPGSQLVITVSVLPINLAPNPSRTILSPRTEIKLATNAPLGIYTIQYSLSGQDANNFLTPPNSIVMVVDSTANQTGGTKPGILKEGCCVPQNYTFYKCPSSTTQVILKSTCNWLPTSTTLNTSGIVFATTPQMSLPVSINGLSMQNGVIQSTATSKKCVQCISPGCQLQLTDVNVLIAAYSLSTTYLENIRPLLPSWVKMNYSVPDINGYQRFDSYDLIAQIGDTVALKKLRGCESIISDVDGAYSALQFNHPLRVKIGEESVLYNLDASSPLCFAVDVCRGVNSPLYIALNPQAQKATLSLSYLQPYFLKGWRINMNSLVMHTMNQLYELSDFLYWNGMYPDHFPSLTYDLAVNLNLFVQLNYGDLILKLQFSGLGYGLFENINEHEKHYVLRGDTEITIVTRIEGDIKTATLSDTTTSSVVSISGNEPSGISLNLNYRPETGVFFKSLFALPDGASCPVSVFASLDYNFALQGLSLYTNCTNLNIGGLVFQNMVHEIFFDGLIGYNTTNGRSNDDNIYSLNISSSLQGDFMKIGTFLTLIHGDNSVEMTILFHPTRKGYFGQMYNVQVTILDTVFNTPVYFQGDSLYFSADAVIFQSYTVHLSVIADLYSQWSGLLLHINGTLFSDYGSFHEKVEACVHKYIRSVASSAKFRLLEAEQNVATRSQQLSELTVEYTNKMSMLNASQNAFRMAYSDLRTTIHTAMELQNNFTILSNTTRQLEDRLSSICDEETCADICIPGYVSSQCYTSVAVAVPYPCSRVMYQPVWNVQTVYTWQWCGNKVCSTYCYETWFLFWCSSSCSTNCRLVSTLCLQPILQPYLSYEPVLQLNTCFNNLTRQLSYQCSTNVSCSSKVPDSACVARNVACREAKKLAVESLEQTERLTAAVLLAYSEARQNLSIAQTNEAIARQRLSKAQESFNATVSAYNNVRKANISAQANYRSIVNEIANDLSLANALDTNTSDNLFKLSSITFNVSIERESPTELQLNFTYQKFQQYYSTLITLDFTLEQEINQDKVVKLLVEHAYNTQAHKRSVQSSKRQLAPQSSKDSSKAKCDDLVNINQFLMQLESSLQSVAIASHSDMESSINLTQSTFNSLESINFTALKNGFNTTITHSGLMDIVAKDKSLALMNSAISELQTVAMQKLNVSDKAVLYGWQSQIDFLLNTTNSIGGNPCFGLKDCLVTVSEIIQQLLQSTSTSWIDASSLLNDYAAVKKNLVAVADNIITTTGDAVYKVNEIIRIINSSELNSYWCSAKPNISDIPFGNQSVVLGGTLNLTCVANSASTVKYQWRKNGNVIPGSNCSSLSIYNMLQSDDGSYVCYASNAAGTSQSIPVNVTVHYSPTFYSTLVSVSTFTGDINGATFSCNATSSPAAGWRWYFKALNADTWKSLIGPNATNEFFIPSPQKKDEGWYRCEAYNDYGSVQSDPAFLRVLGATVSQLAMTVQYLLFPKGPSIILNCSSSELCDNIKFRMEHMISLQHATIKNISIVQNDNSISVNVVVASFNITTNQTPFQSISTLMNTLTLYAVELQSIKTATPNVFANDSFTVSCNDFMFSASAHSLSISNFFPLCPPGQGLHSSNVYCVACAPGQYQTMAELTSQVAGITGLHPVCQPCPLNTYEDQEGSTVCQSCPLYHLTHYTGATSVSDCIAEPLVMDCVTENITSQDLSITCTVNHFPSNFTCSFDNGPIRPCLMPVEASTRLFLPGRHSVVISATDSFQKRAEKVIEYTLKQGPVNGMSIINEAKRVGSLRTAYRIMDSSLLVWEVYQNLGFRYTYTNAAYWPPPQFYAVTNPQPGDVLLFSGYVGMYTRTGYFYGPQVSAGPTEVPFGLSAPYWGSQNLLRGCYHWRG